MPQPEQSMISVRVTMVGKDYPQTGAIIRRSVLRKLGIVTFRGITWLGWVVHEYTSTEHT